MNIFWGMKKLWILQNWTIWCVCATKNIIASIHFKDFLKVKVQNWIFFFGVAIIFLGGMPKFLIFFGVNSTLICRCWVLANESTPTLDIYLLYGKVKFVLNAFIKIMGKI